ncbi:TPA: hypothetical protein DDW69_02615 [candidate division CPR2 bacterium]|uniref:D-alanyl-D-alanine carboxypeptidase, D-alanyl-D-alanine carboxypeptidase (Penicillin-binding protein 5/6) n=1 Tax=candidate division CPR2 bacterium GW2011_GWC1_41_48 TaxID=1618344 RepID=A0A0G0YH63_UNCC2|nr:MAG: Serine-type D-Ala-D-Ala carboxypeptidase [candidate division CPR2 bacterium GW2011_GWC2_39_35]KKR27922.1 MAG: Serine-type D-Ala-D-Ala carboxypeptidase [candidate division CPR2 bacterium GW2011_GWD2_39_7]KKS08896.1 MAG: D-alanyl-D-alanine carboxypeptidase, D-alanyl-D-alanine carboxypeptidase (penicillin-binding protein 5/6) [candidate division CPR2 bacterium GW2011_GWC1_41_48]OGB72040.1 MAG: hypothetical protein A2Y26_01650 [candidate division CPR2 bacterium GWD2_39_7]HBG81713.1 hypothet
MKKITIAVFSVAIGATIFVPLQISKSHKKIVAKKGIEKVRLDQVNELKLKQADNLKYQPKLPQGGGVNYDLDVLAETAIVIDPETGNVLYEKNSKASLPPASIAKILTALVASENMDLNQRLKVSEKAAGMEPNKIVMQVGEEIRLEDLLYGLMMISANDAAEVIAENYPGGRQAFIDKLNGKIEELGLKDTHYMNPSGLDEDDFYASAFDVATITNYCIHKKPEVLKWAGTLSYTIPATEGINNAHSLYHISQLIDSYPYMIASKPGFTDNAGHTLIGVADRSGKKVIMVYFNSPDGMNDGRNLFEYGFAKLGA